MVYKGAVDVTSECVRVICTNTELGTRWRQADTNEPIHSCSKGECVALMLSSRPIYDPDLLEIIPNEKFSLNFCPNKDVSRIVNVRQESIARMDIALYCIVICRSSWGFQLVESQDLAGKTQP